MLNTILTLLITVFVFGLLIFIHEFGHYFFARLFKVGIIEFAIGMGPAIKTFKGKYNDFSIRAIPIGGFVNMVGEYDDEIPEEHKYKIPISARPVWQRMIIVLAGPAMNILLAFVLMFVLVCSTVMGTTIVGEFLPNSVSNTHGLQIGDEIVEINGKNIYCYNDMAYQIASDGINPVDIKVLRNGEETVLSQVVFGTENSEGISFGVQDFKVYAKEKTFGNILYETIFQTLSTVYVTVDSLIETFTGRYGMEAVGGPIAIGGEINNAIQSNYGFKETLLYIVNLMVLLSVSLGVFNLLPIPVLDGGRFVIYLIEAVRRKPLNKKFEQGLSAVCFVLLFGLMILVAFKDIIGLF